jgi:hypothetical protein
MEWWGQPQERSAVRANRFVVVPLWAAVVAGGLAFAGQVAAGELRPAVLRRAPGQGVAATPASHTYYGIRWYGPRYYPYAAYYPPVAYYPLPAPYYYYYRPWYSVPSVYWHGLYYRPYAPYGWRAPFYGPSLPAVSYRVGPPVVLPSAPVARGADEFAGCYYW